MSDPPPTGKTLTSVAITPTSASIAVGATQQFTATATYSDNSTANVTSTASWASATVATATVTSAGLATGVAAGSTAITASLNGVSGSATLTVTAAAKTLKSISVSPANPSIMVGATQQFTATATYSDNSTANVTSTASWTSTTGATATVSSAGLATGVAAGSTTITASLNGISGSATLTVTSAAMLTGVLQWKGSATGDGLYDQETMLTPANVNPTQFGKVLSLATDGILEAQPLYVRNVDLGADGVHDLIIAATENDSVYAFDGQGPSTTPLWRRSFLSPASCTADCITTQPDDHGGRSTFGGQVGITGTPVVDPQTGILYLVAATEQNGTITDTLHAIDIRTGNDAGVGSVVIAASVPGTGEDSVNGQIAFNADYENQRPGLVLSDGVLYVAFGSFSDVPPYHGWLFAYNPATLQAIFNTTPTYTANDPNYEEGIGAGFWNGAASPSFKDDGTFYIVAANGSTDVQNGGIDYGDTVLHLSFENGQFKVLDWFTPMDRDCIDDADLEIGSGGVTLLPAEVGGSRSLALTLSKEGRLFLLDQDNLGHYSATSDQVVQEFMVGANTCNNSTTAAEAADGTTWNRL